MRQAVAGNWKTLDHGFLDVSANEWKQFYAAVYPPFAFATLIEQQEKGSNAQYRFNQAVFKIAALGGKANAYALSKIQSNALFQRVDSVWKTRWNFSYSSVKHSSECYILHFVGAINTDPL